MADGDKPPNEVGYGRPPVHSRWKKGQSGNPTGRRKGVKNFSTVFQDALNERVTVTENGKRKTLSMRQIIVKRTVNKAAAGDPKAAAIAIAEDRLHHSTAAPEPNAVAEFAAAEQETLTNLFSRIRGSEQPPAEAGPTSPEGEGSPEETANQTEGTDQK